MKYTLLTLFGFFIYNFLFAQGENTANQWFFGNNVSVNFSTGIPIGNTGGALITGEGCATVGDIYGNLLFYTDGQEVYNRNNQLMPNGSGLMGSWSATQSSIIIPQPGNDSLFYLFTIDAIENHLQNGLRYSIVNMNLEGGLGDVTSTKNILIETPVSEKITAVLCNNNIDVWLIAHRWNSDEFISFKITNSGINTTPVISAIGSVHQGGYSSDSNVNGYVNAAGYLKANKQGTKLALAIHRMDKFELFDFNKSTGVVSNYFESGYFNDPYGVEFSANGEILYGSQPYNNAIYQFDITQPDPFSNSVKIANPIYQASGLQIGPNGKIYISEKDNSYLSVIDKPNVLGTDCNYNSQTVYLEGHTCRRGLPSIFFYKGFQFFTGSEIDTSICQGDSIYLQNAFQTVEETYYDTVNSYLGWDSIVNTHLSVLDVLPSPTISENSGVLSSSFGANYQWYFNGILITGATNQDYQPLTTGTYQVVIENSNGCESWSDEYYFVYVNVFEINNELTIFPNPTSNEIVIKKKGLFSISLSSLNGQILQIKDDNIDKLKLNLSHLNKGIYILKVISKEKTTIRKIIKE